MFLRSGVLVSLRSSLEKFEGPEIFLQHTYLEDHGT